MNEKQISRVKRDYRYFEARNRCELPGMPADIDSCRLQAYRLWGQLAPQLRGSGTWPDFVIESDFVDTIANELYSDIMQDHGLREQKEAIDKVTNAQQTLMSVLHHSDIPVDITEECEEVDKCYRNRYVEDIAAEIRTAFLMWKAHMDIQVKWNLYRTYQPMLGIFVDADGAISKYAIELQKINSVQTLDVDFEMGQPSAKRLEQSIREQLDKPVYDRVDIAFRIRNRI